MERTLAGLLAKKAVLLVTNQLQYARDARAVVFLEAGRVAACGTYAELLPCEGFANLLKEYEARGRPASPPGPARRGFSDPLLGLWARGLPALPPGLAPARPGPVRSAGLPDPLHLSDLAPACAACTHAVLACGQLRSQLRFLLQWYSPCGSRWPAHHPGRPPAGLCTLSEWALADTLHARSAAVPAQATAGADGDDGEDAEAEGDDARQRAALNHASSRAGSAAIEVRLPPRTRCLRSMAAGC